MSHARVDPSVDGMARSTSAIAVPSRRRSEVLIQVGILLVTFASLAAFIAFFGDDLRSAFLLLVRRASVARVAIYLAYSLGVLALLGGAWLAASGEPVRRLKTFVWARVVRDAAADLLPFSQLGAIVISFRIMLRDGVKASVVYASFVADLTTELVSQLVFTVFGIAMLMLNGHALDDGRSSLGEIGLALVVVAALALAAASARWTLPIASRLVAVALPDAGGMIDQTSRTLNALYRHRAGIASAFLINLVAWLASALGAYLGLRLLGVDLAASRIVTLECLVFAIRSVAFAIPGGLGVQEAAYGLLGPILGIPAEAAVLIALLKRVRDVAIGLPVLAAWQLSQIRKWTRNA